MIIDHEIFGICKLVDTDQGVEVYTTQWQHKMTLTKDEYSLFIAKRKKRQDEAKSILRRPYKSPTDRLIVTPQHQKEIGARVRLLRHAASESQMKLCKAVSIYQPDLSALETGQKCFHRQEIIAIARHYNCTTEWLIGKP